MYTEVGWVRKLMLQSADLLTEMFVISGITLTLIFYDPILVGISIIFWNYNWLNLLCIFKKK